MSDHRFWIKVAASGPDECWPWLGGKLRAGYGQCYIDGSRYLAHRASFFLTHGRWPDPCCLHSCDNPPCCNPSHLSEGTHAHNSADMIAKGRSPKGGHGEHRGWPSAESEKTTMVKELAQLGASILAISKQLHMGRHKVRRILSTMS